MLINVRWYHTMRYHDIHVYRVQEPDYTFQRHNFGLQEKKNSQKSTNNIGQHMAFLHHQQRALATEQSQVNICSMGTNKTPWERNRASLLWLHMWVNICSMGMNMLPWERNQASLPWLHMWVNICSMGMNMLPQQWNKVSLPWIRRMVKVKTRLATVKFMTT